MNQQTPDRPSFGAGFGRGMVLAFFALLLQGIVAVIFLALAPGITPYAVGAVVGDVVLFSFLPGIGSGIITGIARMGDRWWFAAVFFIVGWLGLAVLSLAASVFAPPG